MLLLISILQNPLQVLVNAIINSGPREDSTRIGRAGTVRRQAVDVSPLRRVNQAIWLCCTGAREASFRNIKSIAGNCNLIFKLRIFNDELRNFYHQDL